MELLDTAGGEVIAYYVPKSVELTVIEGDRVSRRLVCNTIVSLHEKEILLSDAVIEALEIEILSPKTGVWRFRGRRILGGAYESSNPIQAIFSIPPSPSKIFRSLDILPYLLIHIISFKGYTQS